MDYVLFVAKVSSLLATLLMYFCFFNIWGLVKILGKYMRLERRWKLLRYSTLFFTAGYTIVTLILLLGDDATVLALSPTIVPWVFLFGSVFVYILTLVFSKSFMGYMHLFEIEPETEGRVSDETEHQLEPGQCYLLKAEKAGKGFEITKDVVMRGTPGMIITRWCPDRVRAKYGFSKTSVIWLATVLREDCVDPTNIQTLTFMIIDFIVKGEKSVIYIEGIDYLVRNNNFEEVLLMLDRLKETVEEHKSTLLLTVNPRVFDRKELALLEHYAESIPTDLAIGTDDWQEEQFRTDIKKLDPFDRHVLTR